MDVLHRQVSIPGELFERKPLWSARAYDRSDRYYMMPSLQNTQQRGYSFQNPLDWLLQASKPTHNHDGENAKTVIHRSVLSGHYDHLDIDQGLDKVLTQGRQVEDLVIPVLIVGKAGSGKSTLLEAIANNMQLLENSECIENIQVKEQAVQINTGTYNGLIAACVSFPKSRYRYCIYDTPALGDESVEWGEVTKISQMVDDSAAGLHRGKCGGIILCLRWDDRFNDYNGRLALDFCNLLGRESLGVDLWDRVVIVVTHCDILPPNIMRKAPDYIMQYVEAQKAKWKKVIQDELMRIRGVQQEVIADEQICFIDLMSKTGFTELGKSISTYITRPSSESGSISNAAKELQLEGFQLGLFHQSTNI
jgi:energy-coupling factor transporter ATP-binding protein EcfA2